jgi:hypothetical protein
MIRPKDSLAILSSYVVITTTVAFGIGFVIGGIFIGLGSAIATFIITSGASIAARRGSQETGVKYSHLADWLIVVLMVGLLASVVIAWIADELMFSILSLASLLSIVGIRLLIRRQRGGHQA